MKPVGSFNVLFVVFVGLPGLILTGSVEESGSQSPTAANRSFTIDPNTYTFLKDGVPFQYISGSMHYFRIPKAYWRDRLEKAKAAGLDAIELYVPWNFHEWEEGAYNFGQDRDIEFFLRLIAEVDLLAIVRAGPYICSEWSFGGLPPWLLKKNPRMLIRSSDPEYFSLVTKWFDVLLPKLRPLLYTNGGPIIMVQLENEYGSSTICDKDYMSMLYDLGRYHLGQDIILFTTDGNSENLLRCGSPDQRYLATVDFGPTTDSPARSFSSVEKFRPQQPLVNSEFYTGWFDQWGKAHSTTKSDLLVNSLRSLLTYSKRVNVNMYLFHGGTNFGFWNGNSGDGPVITSYDFDAPLNEAGDLTEKYMSLRKMIHEFKQTEPSPLPKNTTKAAYGTVQMKLSGHLMANTYFKARTAFPMNMEEFQQYDGFFVYRTRLPLTPKTNRIALTFERFADIAHVYTSDDKLIDLQWHAQLNGPYAESELNMDGKSNHTELLLLLENTGYVNFGDRMWNDVKGLIRNVTHAGMPIGPWDSFYIQDMPGSLTSSSKEALWPVPGSIYTGTLVLKPGTDLHDTFIQPETFGRGIVYINGRNLGRFDQIRGPQRRLFVPRPMLRPEANIVNVIELQSVQPGEQRVAFYAEPLLSA